MGDSRTQSAKAEKGPVVVPVPHSSACRTTVELLEFTSTATGMLAADLFCGAGGLSIGLDAAGIQTVVGIDFDKYALETFQSQFPGLALMADLSDETVLAEISQLLIEAGVAVIAGGPPCQPFSRAGRSSIRTLVEKGIRDPYDRRRDLWQSFLEVVSRVQPRAVIMENVPDMALGDESLLLRLIVEDLEVQGYAVAVRLVDAWRYGVPQHRKRLILVALADRTRFDWPEESTEIVSVDAAIGDLPIVVGGWSEAGGPDGFLGYDGPATDFQRQLRVGIPGEEGDRIYDHITRRVRDDDLQIFSQMDSATLYSEIDEKLKRYRDDIFDDKYKRLDAGGLSRTIIAHIAKDGYGFIHPSQDRTITVREAARLQTFPDRVRFAGPPTSAFRQIGNAVPPLLGQRIGEAIQESLRRAEPAILSTREVSHRLAMWHEDASSRPVTQPWLDSGSIWSVLAADAILHAADNRGIVNTVWPLIEPVDSAQALVEVADSITGLLALPKIGTPSRVEAFQAVVTAAKRSVTGNGDDLDGVSRTSLRLAQLVAGERDVLFSERGVLRPVARYSGRPVDRANQRSDGRIEMARLVGVDEPDAELDILSKPRVEKARLANLALLEIAQSICVPGIPHCGICPLADDCEYAKVSVEPRQGQLR